MASKIADRVLPTKEDDAALKASPGTGPMDSQGEAGRELTTPAMPEPGVGASPEAGQAPRSVELPSARGMDNLYWFGTEGFIFTSSGIDTPFTERHAVGLLLATTEKPFECRVAGQLVRERAVVFGPLAARELHAQGVPLVSLNVQPHHAAFAMLSESTAGDGRLLRREAFLRFDSELARAYEGRLSHAEARLLFEDLIETQLEELGARRRAKPRDPSVELLHDLLRAKPDCSLEEIARALDVSYTGASQLFAETVGLSFHRYQEWLQCMRAVERLRATARGSENLTATALAAGFSDSAHLSQTWRHRFGLTPSYLHDKSRVRIIDPLDRPEPSDHAGQARVADAGRGRVDSNPAPDPRPHEHPRSRRMDRPSELP